MRAIFLPVSKSLMHSILDSNGKTVVGRNNFTDLTQGLTNRRTGGYHTTVSKIGMSIARIFVCGGVRLMCDIGFWSRTFFLKYIRFQQDFVSQ